MVVSSAPYLTLEIGNPGLERLGCLPSDPFDQEGPSGVHRLSYSVKGQAIAPLMHEQVPDVLGTWFAVSIVAHNNRIQDCMDTPPGNLAEALVDQGDQVNRALWHGLLGSMVSWTL
jgi:hypothetical protein